MFTSICQRKRLEISSKDTVLPKPDESFRQASGTKAQVLALLSHTELQHYKPRLKEQRLCLFVPYIYIATQQRPHYSQPNGKYHSQGWTIVQCYELVTAPSYIHTKRCHHTILLARSSYVHDPKGAYARAYATIYDKLIVNTWSAAVHRYCNRP